MLPVPAFDVERLDKAVALYTSLGREAALQTLQSMRHQDFDPVIVRHLEQSLLADDPSLTSMTPPILKQS